MSGLDILEEWIKLSEDVCAACWVKSKIREIPVLMLYLCMTLEGEKDFIAGMDSIMGVLGFSEIKSKSWVNSFVKSKSL